VVELLRASYAVVAGALVELQQLVSLPSGYQRDLQYSKGPLIRALRHGLDALALVPGLLAGLTWRTERMLGAIDSGMYATDLAIEQAAAGVPFRDAYRAAAAAAARAGEDRSPSGSLAARVSPGATAAPRLELLTARLALLRRSP
jgi:argininosuccinate lyase